MIINDTEALARLHSPSNLMNRLRESSSSGNRSRAMSLFGIGTGGAKGNNELGSPKTTSIPIAITVTKAEAVTESFTETETVTDTETKNELSLDKLIDNADTQINLANSHNKAAKLLEKAVDVLSTKIDEIDAEKLPSVINAASKVVNDIRKERNDAAKVNSGSKVNIIFYTPEQRKLSDYSVIDV